MTTTDPHSLGRGDEVTLSTGEKLELPVDMDVTLTAVVLPGNREEVAALLPESLSAIRAGNGTAAVWLITEEFHEVGDGSLGSFTEFAIAIAASPGQVTGIPYISPLLHNAIYIHYLPVSTDSAVAFGEEIWNYPTVAADIDVEEKGRYKQTSVSVDGSDLITLEVKRPRTISQDDTIPSYTEENGTVLEAPAEMSGQMGIWPYSRKFSYTLGDHPKATELRELDLGERAFARVAADVDITIEAGKPV